ncbi:MAG: hypothetical protein N2247_10770 [Leptospiraceae bacterium]|jgi:hypothetical protein|nr:hypothetical protein [Leptospiraceae bacterium]
MDTLVLLLIFLLSLTYCKKEEQSKDIIEEKKQTITGIYEIYPSYEKKYIEFESNGDCKFYTKDKIIDCYYYIYQNYLKIYLEKDKPIGYFYVEDIHQKTFKGMWNQETRFLRFIDTKVER